MLALLDILPTQGPRSEKPAATTGTESGSFGDLLDPANSTGTIENQQNPDTGSDEPAKSAKDTSEIATSGSGLSVAAAVKAGTNDGPLEETSLGEDGQSDLMNQVITIPQELAEQLQLPNETAGDITLTLADLQEIIGLEAFRGFLSAIVPPSNAEAVIPQTSGQPSNTALVTALRTVMQAGQVGNLSGPYGKSAVLESDTVLPAPQPEATASDQTTDNGRIEIPVQVGSAAAGPEHNLSIPQMAAKPEAQQSASLLATARAASQAQPATSETGETVVSDGSVGDGDAVDGPTSTAQVLSQAKQPNAAKSVVAQMVTGTQFRALTPDSVNSTPVVETSEVALQLVRDVDPNAPDMPARIDEPRTPPTRKFAEALTDQIRAAEVNRGRTQIALAPRGLGMIEIEILSDGADLPLRVTVTAENPTVLQAMRNDRDLLLQAINVADGTVFEFREGPQDGQTGQSGNQTNGNAQDPGFDGPADTPEPEHRSVVGRGQLDFMT